MSNRKTGKEQYYTNAETVQRCLDIVEQYTKLKGSKVLEPAGGTGEFIQGFLARGVNKDDITSFDIEPKHELIQHADYLSTDLKDDFLTISNPPFGRKNSLSIKFFNHSANHSRMICYLVPCSWRKWSVQNSLDTRFHLIHDEDMESNCFYLPDGEQGKGSYLKTTFQVWERRETHRNKIEVPDYGLIQKILPKGGIVKGANFEITIFGWGCGKTKRLTGNTKSKSTKMYLHVQDENVIRALEQIDYSKFYKNVSTVWSLSKQEINWLLNEKLQLKN